MDMPLIRLTYRSENALSVSGMRVFVHYHDIVSTARQRNAQHNVTGFLMFDRTRYHQILEGEPATVDWLYARIREDKRHRNIETLERADITERGFPDWSMGSFLNAGRTHPLQERHGIGQGDALAGPTFLKFALDFVREEPKAA
jgi:hypothetical protein